MHQDTVNSYLQMFWADHHSMHFDNKNLSDTILSEIPELRHLCMHKGLCNTSLSISTISPPNGKSVVSFSQKDGVTFADGVQFDIMVLNHTG